MAENKFQQLATRYLSTLLSAAQQGRLTALVCGAVVDEGVQAFGSGDKAMDLFQALGAADVARAQAMGALMSNETGQQAPRRNGLGPVKEPK